MFPKAQTLGPPPAPPSSRPPGLSRPIGTRLALLSPTPRSQPIRKRHYFSLVGGGLRVGQTVLPESVISPSGGGKAASLTNGES